MLGTGLSQLMAMSQGKEPEKTPRGQHWEGSPGRAALGGQRWEGSAERAQSYSTGENKCVVLNSVPLFPIGPSVQWLMGSEMEWESTVKSDRPAHRDNSVQKEGVYIYLGTRSYPTPPSK